MNNKVGTGPLGRAWSMWAGWMAKNDGQPRTVPEYYEPCYEDWFAGYDKSEEDVRIMVRSLGVFKT